MVPSILHTPQGWVIHSHTGSCAPSGHCHLKHKVSLTACGMYIYVGLCIILYPLQSTPLIFLLQKIIALWSAIVRASGCRASAKKIGAIATYAIIICIIIQYLYYTCSLHYRSIFFINIYVRHRCDVTNMMITCMSVQRYDPCMWRMLPCSINNSIIYHYSYGFLYMKWTHLFVHSKIQVKWGGGDKYRTNILGKESWRKKIL